jgi:hypothetical protein
MSAANPRPVISVASTAARSSTRWPLPKFTDSCYGASTVGRQLTQKVCDSTTILTFLSTRLVLDESYLLGFGREGLW